MEQSRSEQWLSVALAEYNSLRAESLASIQYQHSALAFGTAAIGVLIGFSLTAVASTKLLLLVVVIPIFATSIYVLYGIEFSRMIRVGRYIDDLECYMNGVFKDLPPPLGWEGWLDGRGADAGKPRLPFYWVVPLLFSSVVVGSTVMGLILTPQDAGWVPEKYWLAVIFGTISLGAMVTVSVILKNSRPKYDKFLKPDWRQRICPRR